MQKNIFFYGEKKSAKQLFVVKVIVIYAWIGKYLCYSLLKFYKKKPYQQIK